MTNTNNTAAPTMRTAIVYHLTRDAFRAHFGGFGEDVTFPEDYQKVATVEVPDWSETNEGLNLVYRDTNHIDHPWWDNASVQDHKPGSRSTSVGDAILLDDMLFRVAKVGFTRDRSQGG